MTNGSDGSLPLSINSSERCIDDTVPTTTTILQPCSLRRRRQHDFRSMISQQVREPDDLPDETRLNRQDSSVVSLRIELKDMLPKIYVCVSLDKDTPTTLWHAIGHLFGQPDNWMMIVTWPKTTEAVPTAQLIEHCELIQLTPEEKRWVREISLGDDQTKLRQVFLGSAPNEHDEYAVKIYQKHR